MVRLSKKHGVNPSINVCFFCGESKHLILFGKLPGTGDKKAPREICTSIEPCDACKRRFEELDAIVFVEAYEENNKPVPTGSFAAITRSFVQRLQEEEGVFNIDVITSALANNRVCYMQSQVYRAMGFNNIDQATYKDIVEVDNAIAELTSELKDSDSTTQN